MNIIFARHGQSQNNALYEKGNSYTGRLEDPELTEAGKYQAKKLADYLRNQVNRENGEVRLEPGSHAVTHIYCSLMFRAIQTGMFISQALEVPLIARKDLHECGGLFRIDDITGEYIGVPGKTSAEIKKVFPDLVIDEPIDEQGWWNRPFETVEDRYQRARKVLNNIIQFHLETDEIVIVCHRAFYNILMQVLLGLNERSNIWFELYNTAMTKIHIDHEQSCCLIYTNHHSHINSELLTL